MTFHASTVNRIFNSNLFLAFITGAYLSAFYIFNNLTMLNAHSIMLITGVFVSIPVVVVGLLELLLRRVISKNAIKLLATSGCVAFMLIALHQAIILHEKVQPLLDSLGGTESPQTKMLFVVMAVLIALFIGYLSRHDSRVLASMISVMLVVAMLTNAGSVGYIFQVGEPYRSGGLVGENNHLEQTPNIFFIIADSYGSFKHLADNNIDQRKFVKFLKQHGFALYDDAFSNYQPTTSAMAAMLNGEHHYYSISRKFGEVSQTTRTSIAGRNAVVNYLKENGYQTHYIHENAYLLAQGCFVDSCFPASGFAGARWVLTSAVPGLTWDKKMAKWGGPNKPEFLPELDQRLASLDPDSDPMFLYLHLYRPSHPPDRVKGSCKESRELAFYAKRVRKTAKILETVIDRITQSDPDALIVLAGDHGPMLSNKCNRKADVSTAEEYRDRAGALLGIRGPRGSPTSREKLPITTINIFRNLLGSLAEDRSKALELAAAEDVYVRSAGKPLLILKDGVMKLPPQPLELDDPVSEEED